MSTVGLDVGTSRVKAVRFDADWREADSEGEDTRVLTGPGGRSEQDMAEVRDAALRVLRAVAGRSPDRIELVAVTAQGDGCWLVDAAGRPVGPALLWNDARAAGIVDDWQRSGTLDATFAINGCSGTAGVAAAQLRWLAGHEPDRLAAADRLLSCGSWVFLELTGERALEASDAANPFFAAADRRYDPRLPELFGIPQAERLLPPAVSGPDRVAGLRPQVAADLGLPAGTPVALAPYDVVATAVGTGVLAAGSAFGVLGTTLCVGIAADDPALGRPPHGMTLPMPVAGRWLLAHATLVGTQVLDWGARLLGVDRPAALIDLAAGATGPAPLVLPYLSPAGERSPFLDPAVRGAVLDLELGHTAADLAAGLLRGLTLTVVDCLTAAGTPSRLALSGGGARSEVWCRQICDAAGAPVVRPDVTEVGARGALLVGATDAGWFPDLAAAIAAAVRPGQVLEPDPAAGEVFARDYARFRERRRALIGQ